MTHPRDRKHEIDREARRAQVAMLVMSGVTDQRTIARQVNASQPTISRDLAYLEEEWRRQAIDNITAQKGKDLARIDRLIRAIWQDATRGNIRAIAEVRNLLKRRAETLGYDAPTQVAMTSDGSPQRLIIEWSDDGNGDG